MFWAGGWVERCLGLVVGLRDVLSWWTDQEMLWAGGWFESCFGLLVGLRDVLG